MQRWNSLLNTSESEKSAAFKESRDRKVHRRYRSLMGEEERLRPISELDSSDPPPIVTSYGFRSFDRQFVVADSRVGDFMRPSMWQAHGNGQIYITTLATHPLGEGPAATVTALIPDQHHFRGSYGDKGVMPLWRDAESTKPNITKKILQILEEEYGAPVTPERFFAYAYGVLAQPSYTTRFWDELKIPPPRLPITKDLTLFNQVSDHGARLIYLHTYGQRFAQPGDDGFMPEGEARCTKSVSYDQYPPDFRYDPNKRTLYVGDGEFAPVEPEVWDYSVSGLQILKSWLDYRKPKRKGASRLLLTTFVPLTGSSPKNCLNFSGFWKPRLNFSPKAKRCLRRYARPTPSPNQNCPPRLTPNANRPKPKVRPKSPCYPNNPNNHRNPQTVGATLLVALPAQYS